jgi:hypothetical protein
MQSTVQAGRTGQNCRDIRNQQDPASVLMTGLSCGERATGAALLAGAGVREGRSEDVVRERAVIGSGALFRASCCRRQHVGRRVTGAGD